MSGITATQTQIAPKTTPQQRQKYKRPSIGAIFVGLLAGGAVKKVIDVPSNIINDTVSKEMWHLNNSLTEDEIKLVNEAIEKNLTQTGLREKGVNIIKATPENYKKIKEDLKQAAKTRLFTERKRKKVINNMYYSIINGENALYNFATKNILMHPKKLLLAIFHEEGHAANQLLSPIGNILQKSRKLALISIPISLIAFFKTKKASGQKPESKIDKALTFIKENAGKLTFASLLPLVMEEGLASIRGNRNANKLLPKNLATKIKKTNALGLLTYLGTMVAATLGVCLGVQTKDAIAHTKLIKENVNNKQ